MKAIVYYTGHGFRYATEDGVRSSIFETMHAAWQAADHAGHEVVRTQTTSGGLPREPERKE